MRFFTLLFGGLLCFTAVHGQVLADFEDANIGIDSFLNNSGTVGFFTSGEITVANTYTSTPNGNFWTGWGISSLTDNTTPGFNNDGSAITGTGAEGTATYAVGYAFDPIIMQFNQPTVVEEIMVTNSTYAALSMRDGDSFTDPFGGPSGDEPDVFTLVIKGLRGGVLSQDSVVFILADYSFADNSQDYIVDEWTAVDLTSLGEVDELQFSLITTDMGAFGANTPTYFCVDQIKGQLSSTQELDANRIAVYPTPVTDRLIIETDYAETEATVFSLNGAVMVNKALTIGHNQLEMSNLPQGFYFLELGNSEGRFIQKIIKK